MRPPNSVAAHAVARPPSKADDACEAGEPAAVDASESRRSPLRSGLTAVRVLRRVVAGTRVEDVRGGERGVRARVGLAGGEVRVKRGIDLDGDEGGVVDENEAV